MATKLGRGVLPDSHSISDFECFGPPATQDGNFSGTKLADMGCFTQDGKDSNKYYHGAVVKSKKNGQWFAYFEWGRTGASKADFNFIECGSEDEAQREYEKQLHSKNDKRGEWTTLAGKRILQAKAGEDCYLVRPLATRTTGLPDAKKIAFNDGAKKTAVVNTTTAKITSKPKWDAQTIKLMKDMNVGTVAYAKTAVQGGNIPTQSSIDEARDILIEAKKQVKKVGDDEQDQMNDTILKSLTNTLYSRIPKIKRVGDVNWILNKGNIAVWDQDLDAFESALYAVDMSAANDVDPLAGFNIDMSWIDTKSELGKFIISWMPSASRNKHRDVGPMKIHNIWSVSQLAHVNEWRKKVKDIAEGKFRITERALHQPRSRTDISKEDSASYDKANVSMLFHGTRSVNVPGILRENLRLPKQLVGVVITGAMFGGGLYWADDWRKSAGYTSGYNRWGGYNSGAVAGRHAFMFVADVAIGNPFVAPGPRGYTEPPKGHHCVFGKADVSQVMNNEFITFDRAQHSLRYLVEFSA
jgi:hypothetical protein